MNTKSPITVVLALLASHAFGCTQIIKEYPCGDGGEPDGEMEDEDGGAVDDDEPAPQDDGGGQSDAGTDSSTDSGVPKDSGVPDGTVTGDASGSWVDVTKNLVGVASMCGKTAYITIKPDEDKLLVGISQNGFYESTNGGSSWSAVGNVINPDNAMAQKFMGILQQVLFDPEKPSTFWVASMYGYPGVAVTTDDATTFNGLGPLAHNDAVGVDFTDPKRQTLLAGAHEETRKVMRSKDGGKTWDNIGGTLPANSNHSSYVHVVTAGTYLVGCTGSAGGLSGIFRTTNDGASWAHVSDDGGGNHPLVASDDSIYWANRDNGGLIRSTDDGENWELVSGPGTVYRMTPIELPDGRIAMRGPKGVLVSSDQGHNWKVVAPPEPFADPNRIFQMAYSAGHKAFFVAQGSCGGETTVQPNSVVKFSWDYMSN